VASIILCRAPLRANASAPGSGEHLGRLSAIAGSRDVAQLVADAPDIHHPTWEPRRSKLAAHARGVRLERPRRNVRPEAPDVAQQLLAGEDAVGCGCELRQKSELLGRDLHLLAGHRDAAGRPVDRERADLDELDPWRAAPQERVDPREQLL